MNKVITLFGLSIFLCACSSHQNNASISGLTPSDAQKMSSQNAKITEAPTPALKANTRFAAGQLAETQGDESGAIHQYRRVPRRRGSLPSSSATPSANCGNSMPWPTSFSSAAPWSISATASTAAT